jgi:hypothetical protein
MKIGYRRRLADFAGGLRLQREFAKHDRQPREELRHYQQQRLESVVRHAAAHSQFYRERLAGVVGEGTVELSRLPMIDKSEMMEHFDELVTDGRLRRDALLEWVEGLDRDELYLDRYRVMTTSGSSGRKGLSVRVRSTGVANNDRPVPSLQRNGRGSAQAPAPTAGRGHRGRLPHAHDPADLRQHLGGGTPGPRPVRNAAGRATGGDAQPLPTRVRGRLSVHGDAARRGAARRAPPAHAWRNVHEQRTVHPGDERTHRGGIRRASFRPLRHYRRALGASANIIRGYTSSRTPRSSRTWTTMGCPCPSENRARACW